VAVYVCEYCILREETVRERRGSYNGCVVGCIPSFCWIIKMKDLEISWWTYPTLGEPCISVSLLYCVSSVFYFCICFILLLCDPIFLTFEIRLLKLRQ
jgi:hypothetical protein